MVKIVGLNFFHFFVGLTVTVVLGFLFVYLVTPFLAVFLFKKGVFGVDVHKPEKPKIPEMAGVSIVFGLALCSAFSMFYFLSLKFLAYILTIFIACLVGVLDWFKRLGAWHKIFLAALASIPILVLGTYYPYPTLPFIGRLRLTILYPLVFVPILVTLLSNATNMIDVFNGSMAGTSTISAVFLAVIAFFLGRFEAVLMYAAIASCTYAFYLHNRYPAKVFSGDAGSLAVGAAFAAASIIGRMEVVTLFALLPALINGSLTLTSLGGVRERHDIKVRPIILLENCSLAANPSKKAPITLTRLLVASSPLKEVEVVKSFFVLSVFSGFLAFATAVFMVV